MSRPHDGLEHDVLDPPHVALAEAGSFTLTTAPAASANETKKQTEPRSRRRVFRPEKFVYRTAGLPVALRIAASQDQNCPLDRAFIREFWRPRHLNMWLELIAAMILLPLTVPAALIGTTFRYGPTVRRRTGRSIRAQMRDQFRLYFSSGILPPWYYLFELYRDPSNATGRSYLNRFQTDGGVYLLTRGPSPTPLNDKKRFADHCAANGVRHVPYLLYLDGSQNSGSLPDIDLFIKPATGRGGKGTQRWTLAGKETFSSPSHQHVGKELLLERLISTAAQRPLLVQPRLRAHRAFSSLSNGALSTVRVVTCLDEFGDPEVVEALFRMAQGNRSIVDNFHAGGLAAAVSLDDGRLGQASGQDSRCDWVSKHPDTHAQIEGFELPLWLETKQLAINAHQAFADRKIIGWDIAITDDGPVIVEGNSSPDLDMHQRVRRRGLRQSRLASLLAHHLAARV